MNKTNSVEKKKKGVGMSRKKLSFFLLILVGIIAPNLTSAVGDLFDINGIAAKAIGYAIFVINYVIALIASVFIAIEAWIIGIMLQINSNIVSGPIAQKGFEATLAIANLGFVLAIIVIALATILRRETYGIKQLLWKLVFAAILVNFSLVIAGVIMGIGDGLTKQFLESAFQNDYSKFAASIASAFQPQKLMLSGGGSFSNKDI
ncbi:MAG: hypothetical protein AAB655_02685, partial [Patescibacteria group bacterium]